MHNSISKKLMLALAISIGLTPAQQVLAAPSKAPTQSRPRTAPAKQVPNETKEVKAEQPKTAEQQKVAQKPEVQKPEVRRPELDSLCASNPGLEYFVESTVIVFYGPGAQNAVGKLRIYYPQFMFWQVLGYEGPTAKEQALQFRKELKERIQKVHEENIRALKIFGWICLGTVATVVATVAGFGISEWLEQRARDAQDRLRIVQLAQDMFHNIPIAGVNDMALVPHLRVNTPRGAALRNAVIQNGQFYGVVTDDQYQRARERIDEFRLLTLRRGMQQDVYAQTLVQELTDDVGIVSVRHFNNNAFNRIAQMPLVIRNALIEAMTHAHLLTLRDLFTRAGIAPFGVVYGGHEYGYGVIPAQPIDALMPTQDAVRQIMRQRMQAILAQAARQN